MSISPRSDFAAIIVALGYPTLLTLVYFLLLAGQPASWQQSIYAVGKVAQFAFPAVWIYLILRKRFPVKWPSCQGLLWGLGMGIAVGAAMVALSLLWLQPTGFFDGPSLVIREKLRGMGIDTVAKFVALSLFYSLGHSLLEEYYWRWFVFQRLRLYVGLSQAITISSLGFMAHHVIVLGVFFGWASPVAYVFSLGVAVGGAAWAWIYDRSGSLVGPWVSHLLVDAAIFTIGFFLVRDALT